MKLKIQNSNKNESVILTGYNGKAIVKFPYDENFANFNNSYKEFKIHEWIEEGVEEKSLVVIFENDEMSIEMFEVLSDETLHNNERLSKIETFAILFGKNKEDYKKFRGDFGEVLFLYSFGGKKIVNEKSFDIDLNGKFIEVKSYSPKKKTIKMSLQQYIENTLKFAVPIYFDQNGFTIIEMAEKIKNGNEEFYKILKDKYEDDPILSKLKVKNIAPFDFTDQLVDPINLPKNIASAELEIFIKENNEGYDG